LRNRFVRLANFRDALQLFRANNLFQGGVAAEYLLTVEGCVPANRFLVRDINGALKSGFPHFQCSGQRGLERGTIWSIFALRLLANAQNTRDAAGIMPASVIISEAFGMKNARYYSMQIVQIITDDLRLFYVPPLPRYALARLAETDMVKFYGKIFLCILSQAYIVLYPSRVKDASKGF